MKYSKKVSKKVVKKSVPMKKNQMKRTKKVVSKSKRVSGKRMSAKRMSGKKGKGKGKKGRKMRGGFGALTGAPLPCDNKGETVWGWEEGVDMNNVDEVGHERCVDYNFKNATEGKEAKRFGVTADQKMITEEGLTKKELIKLFKE